MSSTFILNKTKIVHPAPFINYANYCKFPEYIGEEKPDETGISQEDIKLVMAQATCSRSQAVKSLRKNSGDLINALMDFTIIQNERAYPITEPIDKRGIQCIIGVPSMKESGIYSLNGKPVILSNTTAEHYGIEKLEDIIGKPVVVFRRKKDEGGNYITPTTYYLQKATIKKFNYLGRFDMAEADIIETSTGEETESLRIQRICIDWENQ
jgi:hypothetical protein